MSGAQDADRAADTRVAKDELMGAINDLCRAGKIRQRITWIGRDGKEVDAATCPPARLKNTIAMYARKGMHGEAEALRAVARRRGVV